MNSLCKNDANMNQQSVKFHTILEAGISFLLQSVLAKKRDFHEISVPEIRTNRTKIIFEKGVYIKPSFQSLAALSLFGPIHA